MRRLLRQNPWRPVYTANASNIRVLVKTEPYPEHSMYSVYPSSSYLEPVTSRCPIFWDVCSNGTLYIAPKYPCLIRSFGKRAASYFRCGSGGIGRGLLTLRSRFGRPHDRRNCEDVRARNITHVSRSCKEIQTNVPYNV